jgi:protocatechuate 3,4-dioxygenase beta subunit
VQPSLAERPWVTPAQVEGPYYPRSEPAEKDWNLIQTARAKNEIAGGIPLQLEGQIFDSKGLPLNNAEIEIWQSDYNGFYGHPKAPGNKEFDSRFQGFARVITNLTGSYRFLTIVPAKEKKRPPHIHVKIFYRGKETLTTQLYLKGHPENNSDSLLSLMLYPGQQKLLIDPTDAILENGISGKKARFDFVVTTKS